MADAVETFEEALACYDWLRGHWPGMSVAAHYWLGVADERSGWLDRAVEQYETFLHIWRNADPEAPFVDDARQRLARLQS